MIQLDEIKNLEKKYEEYLQALDEAEAEEFRLEGDHIQLMADIYNNELVARLPNQTLRDNAVDSMLYADQNYKAKHEAYLLNKLKIKKAWRTLRFLEEQIKNRRAEINYLIFSKEQ